MMAGRSHHRIRSEILCRQHHIQRLERRAYRRKRSIDRPRVDDRAAAIQADG